MLIFLYGEDSFRSRQKLKEFRKKFTREVDPTGASLSLVDGVKANLGEINEQVSPSSLLAKKRMIVIENIFQNKSTSIFEELEKFLNKIKNNDNIIIFWDSAVKTGKKGNASIINSSGEEKSLTVKPAKLFKFLNAQKYAQEFKALSNTELGTWVKKEVETRGGKISPKAVNALAGLVGTDLWQINNEINKLINYKLGTEPQLVVGQSVEIQLEDVEYLVRGNFSENIFALTDAISAKNKTLAIRLIEEQFEAGLTESYLLSMFVRQFKILLQIRQALETGAKERNIASDLKLHPFVVQKGIAQARNFTLVQLKNIINKLVEADYAMKTGQGDMHTALDLLIAEI
ncbi:MAG: DNA polymerase III subunit delta [Patescibacteria group bacterium]|nr:DNA polymerase III subunit delta [Patescibacteria group bacterium]MDD4610648.1 DNA polymerase III subunit delta [Patescibacteria group bacterium]